VRFVDVTLPARAAPSWLMAKNDDVFAGPDWPVAPLLHPEVPTHARPALAPVLESVRPAPMPMPMSVAPSKYPSARPPPPSQYPGQMETGLPNLETALAAARRSDTLIENLVPRVEEEAAAAISEAIERFMADRARSLEAAEGQLIELCKVICRRVLLRELEHNPLLIEGLVRAGLEALGGGDRLTVRLGPFFEEAVDLISHSLQRKGIDCTVLVDPRVGPQGCQLETELGRVDESVEARLDVLLSSLDVVP